LSSSEPALSPRTERIFQFLNISSIENIFEHESNLSVLGDDNSIEIMDISIAHDTSTRTNPSTSVVNAQNNHMPDSAPALSPRTKKLCKVFNITCIDDIFKDVNESALDMEVVNYNEAEGLMSNDIQEEPMQISYTD
jgi:hypothetical protein